MIMFRIYYAPALIAVGIGVLMSQCTGTAQALKVTTKQQRVVAENKTDKPKLGKAQQSIVDFLRRQYPKPEPKKN